MNVNQKHESCMTNLAWKNGEPWNDNLTGINIARDQFDCGKYFFDGYFNVVKFPRGMTLFHGSSRLANANSEFPVGFNYYNPASGIVSNPNRVDPAFGSTNEIEDVISTNFAIDPSWFGTLATARAYSATNPGGLIDPNIVGNCGPNCVAAYTLKKSAVMILLDDDYNISHLLHLMPINIEIAFRQMFGLSATAGQKLPSRIGALKRLKLDQKKNRYSDYNIDRTVANWLCANVITLRNYAGYSAPVQKTSQHGPNPINYFHSEFIFCNALKWLKRDLQNQHDWQRSTVPHPPLLNQYVSIISKFESCNTDFHAGNLYEHSIWALLYAEYTVIPLLHPMQGAQKLACMCSFLHDIGKVNVIDTYLVNLQRNKFIFHTNRNHPIAGRDYVMGNNLIIYDDHLANIGTLNVRALITEMSGDDYVRGRYRDIIAIVIAKHREFGELLKNFISDPLIGDGLLTNQQCLSFVNSYMPIVLPLLPILPVAGEDEPYAKLYIYCLLVTSISDIYSSQQYGNGRLTNAAVGELNARSTFFPSIQNVPKKYKGGNVVIQSKIPTHGIQIANFILTNIDEIYRTPVFRRP